MKMWEGYSLLGANMGHLDFWKNFLQNGEINVDCQLDVIQKTKFDFTWYPFDAHTFQIPLISGKIINNNSVAPEATFRWSKLQHFYKWA